MIRIKIRDLNILTERVVIFYTQTTIFIMNTLDNQHGSLEIGQMLIQGEIVNILLKIKNSFLPTKQILIGL